MAQSDKANKATDFFAGNIDLGSISTDIGQHIGAGVSHVCPGLLI